MSAENTLLLGLIGEHLDGSQTPALHEAEGARQGLSIDYRLLDSTAMRPDGLPRTGGEVDWPQLLRQAVALGYQGLNVTHPAKQAIIPALDELSEDAALLGAVNTVVVRDGRLRGENTDHSGFSAALAAHGIDAARGPVVQLGAGGAGSAVAYALLRQGVPELTLVDVDPARSGALKQRLSAGFAAERIRTATPDGLAQDMVGASGLVNCTPIGMDGVSSDAPLDLGLLRADLWVGDVVYRPLRTRLVIAAQELGCTAFGGSAMVVGQAADAFELFTGRTPDAAAMRSDFEHWVAPTAPTGVGIR